MKMLVCGGGTGGHINPAIAVAGFVKARRLDAEIVFAGASRGMEEKLVPQAGYELHTVDVSGFKRSFTPSAIVFNVGAAFRMLASRKKAYEIVKSIAPDVVFGTGGYACFPYVQAAHKLGIPCVLHESNALPGKAVINAAKYAEKILLGFPEAKERLPKEYQEKAIITGNPIRSGMAVADPEAMKAELGYAGKKLVLSFWGSLGAREMNKMIADFIALEAEEKPGFAHVHATGTYGWRWMPELVAERVDLKEHPDIDMREYIHNMPQLLAAADLVICRAGAMTTIELSATGTPAIIVPSPNVAENHQESNARALEGRGSAVVVLEKECSGKLLYEKTKELLADDARLKSMSKAALDGAILDADQRIYEELRQYWN
ncbi:MAG: UDP-N-acetylglucosamine--N-acetylmuramyl-(pentapeptide) pyrophosphoryl-undecaprenol N-acetylglucosamine transferase [Clostridia bacterium]|nr:UDP-N-acetylglucosamine--N-acetylmuramyl-(pentapeptide) pyrophosphoryl-undecaprenol N-acetylglucosamine transferase [Clostridia bacterium]